MTNDKVTMTLAGSVRELDPKIAKRIKMERQVVRAFVKAALGFGYTISVHDGEACPVKRSRSVVEIMAAIMACDVERLIVRNAAGEHMGTVLLVYGNDGWDVIADYSTTLEDIMTNHVDAVIARVEERAAR